MNRRSYIVWSISLLCGWMIWEYSAHTIDTVSYILPSPSIFVSAMIDAKFSVWLWSQATTMWQSIWRTLARIIVWLMISIVCGIVTWIGLSHTPRLRHCILPYIQLIAPIAPIAWIPLGLVLFGIWNTTAIFIVSMAIFPSLTLSIIQSIQTIPANYIQIADNIWCSTWDTIRHVILPAIAPSIITNIRLNFIGAWMAILASEMTWLQDGLWALILIGRNLFNNNLILFGICTIGVLGYAFDYILQYCGNRFLWRGKL
jgi:NitT/TauT family transport system permease protein